jgi:hypothetical protein
MTNEEVIVKVFDKKVREQYQRGLAESYSAICSVVLEKATNDKVSDKEKLQDIIDFCNTSLGTNK